MGGSISGSSRKSETADPLAVRGGMWICSSISLLHFAKAL